jgi:hypothetical protein
MKHPKEEIITPIFGNESFEPASQTKDESVHNMSAIGNNVNEIKRLKPRLAFISKY